MPQQTLLVTDFNRQMTNFGSFFWPVRRYVINMSVLSRHPLPSDMVIAGVSFTKIHEHEHDDHEHHEAKLYHTILREIGMSKKKYKKFRFQYAPIESL